MAATVGATLSGVTFPLRHAGLGPFMRNDGLIFYFFGRNSTNSGQVQPMDLGDGSSNPAVGDAWSADTVRTMSSATSTAIEAMACYQVGDLIHVATQISTGAVYYNSYSIATDNWTLGTSELAVAAASFAPTAGNSFVSLVVRSGGEVVIAYCAGLTAMASGFHMARYTRRTATNTYSAPVNIDNGGSVNWTGCVAALGASDRVHFFFKDQTNSDFYQRTLSAANALQAFPAATDATADATNPHIVGPGVSYVSGATTKVSVPYSDSGATTSTVIMDSADAPTVTAEAGAGGSALKVTNSQVVHALASDSTTRHLLYSDSTATDLQHDTSAAGAAWGADTNELAATVNAVTPNVYSRAGSKYLAMIVDDGGALKYAEIPLSFSLIYAPNQLYSRILAVR